MTLNPEPPLHRPLLVVGLDGATWDLIGPWADSLELPLFGRLRKRGAWGPLRSVTPNLTPPGWTTAFTGVNPGKHGIFDFFTLDPGTEAQRIVTSRDRKSPALWEILAHLGISSGVFNVPSTYPADPVPGFFVSGMGTPGFHGDWAAPESVRSLIRRRGGAFRFGVDHRHLEVRDYGGFLDALYELTDTQEEIVLRLIKEHGPRVLVFVYDDLDRVLHFFWRFLDETHPRHQEAPDRIARAILEYHRRIEEGILRLRHAMGPDTDLCILSDHGFGPLHTDVYLNRILADRGYLHPIPAASELIRKPLWKRAVKPLVPSRARSWFRRRVKASPLGNPLGFIDFDRTRAFYASVSGRSVYINLKGRQPRGIVEPGREYEELRAELKEFLLGLRDPETGVPVVRAVHFREEAYSGPHVEKAPDLLLQEDGRFAYRVDWAGRPFAPASQYGVEKSGSHRPDGILLLDGPSFRSCRLEGARLEDVTPTLLAALGLPGGTGMDGRALSMALVRPPVGSTADYSGLRGGNGGGGLGSSEEAELAERLKGLGYM